MDIAALLSRVRAGKAAGNTDPSTRRERSLEGFLDREIGSLKVTQLHAVARAFGGLITLAATSGPHASGKPELSIKPAYRRCVGSLLPTCHPAPSLDCEILSWRIPPPWVSMLFLHPARLPWSSLRSLRPLQPRFFSVSRPRSAIDMATVDTSARLTQLRKLMQEQKVDVYSMI